MPNINNSEPLNLFSMEDNKNSIAIRWQEQPPPKTILLLF